MRSRKELSRARAGEERALQEADDQADKLNKFGSLLLTKARLQEGIATISNELKVTHKMSQVREEKKV
jgi:Tfp pilus assembly protein PilF